jgi:hypothetical protein
MPGAQNAGSLGQGHHQPALLTHDTAGVGVACPRRARSALRSPACRIPRCAAPCSGARPAAYRQSPPDRRQAGDFGAWSPLQPRPACHLRRPARRRRRCICPGASAPFLQRPVDRSAPASAPLRTARRSRSWGAQTPRPQGAALGFDHRGPTCPVAAQGSAPLAATAPLHTPTCARHPPA